MKKVITVLAILVVLVGAVFADDTNTAEAKRAYGSSEILIKAKVPEAVPQFQLKIAADQGTLIEDAKATVGLGTISYNESTGAVTGITAAATAKDPAALKDAAITTLTTTTNKVTINFDINQVAKANLKAGYKVTVTAEDLKLKTFLNNDALAAADFVASKHSFTVDSAAPAVTAVTTEPDGVDLEASANTLTVDYNGSTQVIASDDDPVKLGTFAVAWTGNKNAVAGNYESTVTMTVTAK